ncbi:MAG: metalloregulator ArsR/SmtB family transcription factor [Kiritimatiellae bacterium]|nr:metalloregulator ArsR/SmtB family transcription factor [Kiritimatiellia bacterium]MDD4737428.1 metalloregulator ArsR/SmtB family transcription factor [Kiritimatiellia bacterium]
MKMNEHKPIPDEELSRAAECLKLMAHPVRLRMADLLTRQTLPVSEVAEACALPPSQACGHLRQMQRHGLLVGERRGRQVFYRASSPRLLHLMECLRKNCMKK